MNTQGLFSRAIIQSNPVSLPWKEKSDGRALQERFSKALNCDYPLNRKKKIDCLRYIFQSLERKLVSIFFLF